MGGDDLALGIDEDRGRKDTVAGHVHETHLLVEHHRARRYPAREQVVGNGLPVLTLVGEQYRDVRVRRFLGEHGKLPSARRTPGRPQIDRERLAREIFRRDLGAIHSDQDRQIGKGPGFGLKHGRGGEPDCGEDRQHAESPAHRAHRAHSPGQNCSGREQSGPGCEPALPDSEYSPRIHRVGLPMKHDISDPCRQEADEDGHACRGRGPAVFGNQDPIDQEQECYQQADCQQAIGCECERSKGNAAAHRGPSRDRSLSETYGG